jgi:hypothetical protein
MATRRDRDILIKRTNNNNNPQEENKAPPQNSAIVSQQQQQTATNNALLLPQFFPSNLVTPVTADLLDKMRDSTDSYRAVVTHIEQVVMLGCMRGYDERTIMMQCRAVLESNPIVEVDI